MKLTIKVKHLVTALISIGVVLLLLQYIVMPKVQVYKAQKQFEQGSTQGKENLLTVIAESRSPSQKWELIRKYMIETGEDSVVQGFDVYAGPGFTQTNTVNPDKTNWSWEERLPFMEAYLADGPANEYMVRAAKQLAYYYGSEGNPGQALAALELAESRLGADYAELKQKLMLEQAKLYAGNNEVDKAERILDGLTNRMNAKDMDFKGEVAQLKVRLWIQKGDVQGALITVSRELEALEKEIVDQKKQFPDIGNFKSVKLEQLTSLKEQLEHSVEYGGGSISTVSGTIERSDGTPMARIGVYLRERKAVNHSVTDGEPYQVLTDSQGHYEIKGVLPGSYQLNIGLLFEQIDGWTWPTMNDDWIDVKEGQNQSLTENIVLHPLIEIKSPINQQVITGNTISFKWEPVRGAVYYNLNGSLPIENGSFGILIRTNIRDNHIELPVEKLYDLATGIAYKTAGDKQVVDASTLLGFANPDNRFAWSVEAYDEHGRLLTRSNGYRLNENTLGDLPFFYLKERTMTEADQMLKSDKMDDALVSYKKSYEIDKQDRHSLRMIIRIYEAIASSKRQMVLSEEALPYVMEMIKVNPAGEYIFKLIDYFRKKEDWMQVDKYYTLLAKANDGRVEPYVRSIYATSLMNQSRLKEAGEQFEQAMAQDRSHRFIGPYLAIELHEQGTFENAKKLAIQYPERSIGEVSPVWAELIQDLEIEADQSDAVEYWVELNEKLEWFFAGDRKQIDPWMTTTKHSAMRAFIKALFEVN